MSTSDLKGLLLLGGKSTRMGTDKALLPVPPDGKPLFRRQYSLLASVCPGGVVVSARPSQLPVQEAQNLTIVHDAAGSDIGPAAGLLAAHGAFPFDTFLVLAIDFPLASADLLSKLIKAHSASSKREQTVVAPLHASDCAPEPFMSLWSPAALERLRYNCEEREGKKRTGPCFTMKELWKELEESGGVEVGETIELRNTNTEEEWRSLLYK